MGQQKKLFDAAVEKKVFDLKHRATVQFNISRYDTAVIRGKTQYQNLELARMRAASC